MQSFQVGATRICVQEGRDPVPWLFGIFEIASRRILRLEAKFSLACGERVTPILL
jgi:hypothetical protein